MRFYNDDGASWHVEADTGRGFDYLVAGDQVVAIIPEPFSEYRKFLENTVDDESE